MYAYICLYCTDRSEVTKALPLVPLAILVEASNSLLILLYPVGPVGCAPQVSRATKSSTWRDGGLEVLGGLDLNKSGLWGTDLANPRDLMGVTRRVNKSNALCLDY